MESFQRNHLIQVTQLGKKTFNHAVEIKEQKLYCIPQKQKIEMNQIKWGELEKF